MDVQSLYLAIHGEFGMGQLPATQVCHDRVVDSIHLGMGQLPTTQVRNDWVVVQFAAGRNLRKVNLTWAFMLPQF